MAAPYEIFQSRDGFTKDSAGIRTGQRIFNTDYRDAPSAIEDVTYSVIPPYSATFPSDSALRLDRKRAVKRDDGTFQVVCEYSNNEQFVDQRIDKKAGLWYSWQGSVQSGEATIFVAARRALSLPNPGAAPTVTYKWVGTPYRIKEKRQTLTLNIRTSSVTTPNPFAAIAAQFQKLHKIGEVYWLFLGGDASQTNNTDWEFTYQWQFDGGTRKPDVSASSDVFVPTPDGMAANSAYARLAYSEVVYIDQDDPESGPGDTYSIKLYTKDDNGWLGLPGVAGVVGA